MNYWRWKPVLPLLALFAITCAARAAENMADYAHLETLDTNHPATWYQVDLPIRVALGAAHADLRDLRVFNAEGETLPYALVTSAERHTRNRREVSGKLFPLYADDESSPEIALDGSVTIRRSAEGEVTIELPAGPKPQQPHPRPRRILRGWLIEVGAADFPLEGLAIQWQAGAEGFYAFTVEASNDLEHWRHWAHGQIVHLSFNDETIDQSEVRLPGGKARYLRLVWQESWVAEAIREVRLFGTATGVELAPLVWSAPLPGAPVAGREGEYVWQLPATLQLARVRIPLAEDNTLAPVILSGRNFPPPAQPASADATQNKPLIEELAHDHRRLKDVLRPPAPPPAAREIPWQTLARGVLYRLPAIALQDDELELPGGAAFNQLRLQVDVTHGGNAFGHATPELVVAVRAHRLSFLARGAAPYRLAWGNPAAKAAALPLSTLIPGAVGPDQLGRARLGGDAVAAPVNGNVSANVAPPPAAGEPSHGKLALWAVLLAGVVLLAAMAVSLLRAARRNRKE
jgi:hypothetical protein